MRVSTPCSNDSHRRPAVSSDGVAGSSRGESGILSRLRAVSTGVAGQATIFSVSSGAVSIAGAVSKVFLGGLLSLAGFGAFAFAVSLQVFAGMLFEFGLFLPVARAAARTEGIGRRELIGAALALYVPVGLLFSVTLFTLSFFVDDVFNVRAGEALRIAAPLGMVYPFTLIALKLAEGTRRLNLYSGTSLLGQFVFVAFLAIAIVTPFEVSPATALLARSAGLATGALILVTRLRPVFRHVRRHVAQFATDARAWGFQVYVGRVLSIGTYNMDVLMLGALTDAKTVGLYVLAGAIASIVGLPLSGAASALFPRMVASRGLRRRWIALGCATSGFGVIAAWVLAGPFLDAVFSPGYHAAARYVLPLAIAEAIRGVTGLFNSYLAAQARGRDLRNAGAVLTVSNLILNLALIPSYGATGAAWASVVALIANLAAHVHGYRRSMAALPST